MALTRPRRPAGPGRQVHRTLLLALSLEDGRALWRHALPGLPAAWGLAVDRNGQVIATLQDGRVLCFGAEK